ncbi:hypothetical protein FNV43_RR04471 [Rhamnella rubrinervis]|uniref:Uncharacterized protein n=1 Tax=Rhamnella rubrinervis TaxID=2594499 RepID=A0A8K0MPL1_9ROSA|nr:hypothetical protein FNV43_RR04471 [Rhamnella rubrinervis]
MYEDNTLNPLWGSLCYFRQLNCTCYAECGAMDHLTFCSLQPRNDISGTGRKFKMYQRICPENKLNESLLLQLTCRPWTKRIGAATANFRLWHFPNTTVNKNQLSAVLLQGYASAAESVKNALISEFTTREIFDVESMVDVANNAFTVLGSLYEAKKELEREGSLQNMEAHHSQLYDRSDGALKALLGAKVSLAKTEKEVTPLVTQIVETRELLNKLEEKLMQGNAEIGALQEKCERLGKSYDAAKTEEQNVGIDNYLLATPSCL